MEAKYKILKADVIDHVITDTIASESGKNIPSRSLVVKTKVGFAQKNFRVTSCDYVFDTLSLSDAVKAYNDGPIDENNKKRQNWILASKAPEFV